MANSKNGSIPPCNPSPVVVQDNVLSEMAAFMPSRQQDYATTPERIRLMAASGVQSPDAAFPNPDPRHDGSISDTGPIGVLDFRAGINENMAAPDPHSTDGAHWLNH